MIILIITLCASASMTDCTIYSAGTFETLQQCKTVARVNTEVLGTGPNQNYRLECQSDEEATDDHNAKP